MKVIDLQKFLEKYDGDENIMGGSHCCGCYSCFLKIGKQEIDIESGEICIVEPQIPIKNLRRSIAEFYEQDHKKDNK